LFVWSLAARERAGVEFIPDGSLGGAGEADEAAIKAIIVRDNCH
jgi:hypothetical protein